MLEVQLRKAREGVEHELVIPFKDTKNVPGGSWEPEGVKEPGWGIGKEGINRKEVSTSIWCYVEATQDSLQSWLRGGPISIMESGWWREARLQWVDSWVVGKKVGEVTKSAAHSF